MSDCSIAHLATAASGPKPARLAVIGRPVSHSLSPRMHQRALDEAGIAARYIPLDVAPGEVPTAFARMRELGFLGCNVTVPHKLEALAACDEIDDTARRLGAVNTVRFDPDATRGTNTDGEGFERAIGEALGLQLAGLSLLILGAGGGAGSALAAHCAAHGVSRLILSNRTESKATALAQKIRQSHPKVDLAAVGGSDDPMLPVLCASARLLVNATSLGLQPDDPSPLPPGSLHRDHAIFDTVYRPTALRDSAHKAGCAYASGELMLLYQGIAAFRYWFPDQSPAAAMRRGLFGS